MALSTSCNASMATSHTSMIARPFGIIRPIRRCPQQIARSMVSKDSLPEQYRDESKYKLHFVCFSRLAPEQTTAQFQECLPGHLEWLQSVDKEGQLAFHGNFVNPEASNYGSGMYALICDSTADAKALAEQDPLHANGIRRFEMLPWVQQTQW